MKTQLEEAVKVVLGDLLRELRYHMQDEAADKIEEKMKTIIDGAKIYPVEKDEQEYIKNLLSTMNMNIENFRALLALKKVIPANIGEDLWYESVAPFIAKLEDEYIKNIARYYGAATALHKFGYMAHKGSDVGLIVAVGLLGLLAFLALR